MNADEMWTKIEALQEEILEACIVAKPEDLGLDSRCNELWMCPEYIASQNRGSLDYYGGFEYIEKQYIVQIGDLTVYSCEDSRVQEALDCFVGENL